MRPILLRWRGSTIHSYPAMLYLGLVFGLAGGNIAAKAAGLNSARVFLGMLLLLIPALAGSRLLFVARNWEIYRGQRQRIWRRGEGGADQYGGLLLAAALSVPLLDALDLPFWRFWDVATFTVLIGAIFTRIGCLLNGCCAGRPSEGPLGLYLPNHRGVWRRRIPTQLMEAALALLLLAGSVTAWGRLPFPGGLFLGVLAVYGGARIVLEVAREEQERLWGGVTVQQAISAGILLLSLALLVGVVQAGAEWGRTG